MRGNHEIKVHKYYISLLTLMTLNLTFLVNTNKKTNSIQTEKEKEI